MFAWCDECLISLQDIDVPIMVSVDVMVACIDKPIRISKAFKVFMRLNVPSIFE